MAASRPRKAPAGECIQYSAIPLQVFTRATSAVHAVGRSSGARRWPMEIQHPIRLRLGALALGASALLLALFPLVRPFFPLDVFSPALADVASPALRSAPWLAAHLMATAAFALLPWGFLALHAGLAAGAEEPRAHRAALLGLLGAALVLPALGVETFAMPAIAAAHLDGGDSAGRALAPIYRGPMTLVLLAGLAVLAWGALAMARAIWRSRALPPWAGLVFAIGLAGWLPLLP